MRKRRRVAKRKASGYYSDASETVTAEDVRQYGKEAVANLGLAMMIYKRKGIQRHMTPEEWQSEAFIVLVRCLRNFDSRRSLQFSTYACRALLWQAGTLKQRAARDRMHIPSAEGFWRDVASKGRDELPHVDCERMEAAIAELSMLKPRLAFVIRFYFYNSQATYDDVKALLGVSRERVRQLVVEACAFLRTTLRRMAAEQEAA